MQYLVDMSIAVRPTTLKEGITFVESQVLPSLAMMKEMKDRGTIVAGGPKAGQSGIAFILQADSAQEFDELLEGLPIWPRMQTVVTPLATFEGRETGARKRLEAVK